MPWLPILGGLAASALGAVGFALATDDPPPPAVVINAGGPAGGAEPADVAWWIGVGAALALALAIGASWAARSLGVGRG